MFVIIEKEKRENGGEKYRVKTMYLTNHQII